ncbi:hypothetical protein A9Q68_08700 [Streptococcus bovimastitidis]|uniref:Competence protein ComGG n=1 Tax=Streptococcus bovimastitidis TaxID=1856638 RepID=A0A1L8MKL0_9STRE|nr:competence type IV pilus minor pilin ComGG [Streptococcus bovimastitidis]OJF71266.1 hypothetical protein A9Q68_08700 [Streptococcus bovimastitidis]
MILKKNLKAGVLVYAILMSAVFISLVEVYLKQVADFKREHQAQVVNLQAQMIGEYIKMTANKGSGSMVFDQGKAEYLHLEDSMDVSVTLTNGQAFTFNYPLVEKGDKSQERSIDQSKGKKKERKKNGKDSQQHQLSQKSPTPN